MVITCRVITSKTSHFRIHLVNAFIGISSLMLFSIATDWRTLVLIVNFHTIKLLVKCKPHNKFKLQEYKTLSNDVY